MCMHLCISTLINLLHTIILYIDVSLLHMLVVNFLFQNLKPKYKEFEKTNE